MIAAVQTLLIGDSSAGSRLKKSAQDFEAMLLTELLKFGSEEEPGGGELDSGSLQGYEDLRNQAVAGAMANSGGVGIAKMLVQHLSQSGDH